eukprot:s1094_g2.t1
MRYFSKPCMVLGHPHVAPIVVDTGFRVVVVLVLVVLVALLVVVEASLPPASGVRIVDGVIQRPPKAEAQEATAASPAKGYAASRQGHGELSTRITLCPP